MSVRIYIYLVLTGKINVEKRGDRGKASRDTQSSNGMRFDRKQKVASVCLNISRIYSFVLTRKHNIYFADGFIHSHTQMGEKDILCSFCCFFLVLFFSFFFV